MSDLITTLVFGSILIAPLLFWTYGIIMAVKNKKITSLIICTLMLTTCGTMYNNAIEKVDTHNIIRKIVETDQNLPVELTELVAANHINIKNNANVSNLDTNILNALPTIISAYREVEGNDFIPTITSGNDSEHMHNSLHYINKAIDIRTITDRKISMEDSKYIYRKLKASLDSNKFRVLFEGNHIHVSYLK
jgi:hypothetical protein